HPPTAPLFPYTTLFRSDNGEVHRIGGTTTLHYLYRREAELLFSEAGFVIETLHGDYDGNPADAQSRKLLVVAKRKERGQRPERRSEEHTSELQSLRHLV